MTQKSESRRVNQSQNEYLRRDRDLLASVMINSDAKRGLDVSSSLTDLGHLPG